MRDKHFDIDAFPELHPKGNCGLDYESRIKTLSRVKYYAQRIMNIDPRYRENADFMFMAQQASERFAIESQIKMAMSHGSVDTDEKGSPILVPSDDAFAIFNKVPGTPAYWKCFKNELYSKMEALGPFHLFFTLSCAEMRWACVLLAVLKAILKRKLNVMYLDNFILVDEKQEEKSDEKKLSAQSETCAEIDAQSHQEKNDNQKVRQNVAWNGEANTVLIYDEALSICDMPKKTKENNDSEWEEDRKEILDKKLKKIGLTYDLEILKKEKIDLEHGLEQLEAKQMKNDLNEKDKETITNQIAEETEKLAENKRNTELRESLDFVIEDVKEQQILRDFIIELEDPENELKDSDIEKLATYKKVERNKIMTLENYLNRYLKQNSMNKTDFLKNHFVLITQLFDKRARDFIDTVMKEKGFEDYAFRVEFQLRGLPHIHGVAWLNYDADDRKELLDETGTFIIQGDNPDGLNQGVINEIEKWISCKRSRNEDKRLNEIVEECQKHRHTKKSCLKRGNGCRFNFPRPPSNRTMISRPVENVFPELSTEDQVNILKKAKEVLTIVKKALEDLDEDCVEYDDDLERFLKEKCLYKDEIIDVALYHKYLQISSSGSSVILERKISERFINNYNPDFQRSWNANTDIQLCLDSFAVVTYITDYLTKGDTNLTKTLITALKENRDADKFNLLNHLKKVYFKSKQTCVCEAAYRLIPGLNLKGSSLSCLFVASGFPHKRKKYVNLMDKDDDKEYDPIEDEEIEERFEDQHSSSKDENPKPNKKQGNNFKKVISLENKKLIEPESKHKKYEMRPKDTGCDLFCDVDNKNIFDGMCFAKFSTLYEYNNSEPKTALWHIIKEDEAKNCGVTLEMIRDHISKKKKDKKKVTKSSSNEVIENENDDKEEVIEDQINDGDEVIENDTDDEDEEKEKENNMTSCEIAEMNSSLPSNLRWGPPLNKVKGKKSTSEIRNNTKNQPSVDSFFPIQATFEIGYTKRYFDLTKKINKLPKLLKYIDKSERQEDEYSKDYVPNRILPQWIRLSNGRTMKLRIKPYALRLYSFPKDIIQHKYSELILFTAWRNEKKDFWLVKKKSEQETYFDSNDPDFANKLEMMKTNKKSEWEKNRMEILPFSKKLSAIKELMENDAFQRSETIYDSVNPQAVQQNEEDAADFDISDQEDEFPEVPESSSAKKTKNDKKRKDAGSIIPEKCIFKKSILPDDMRDLHQSIRDLTYEQRVIFDKYIHYLQSLKCVKHGGDIMPEPPRIIAHGNYITLLVYYLPNKIYK